MPEEKKDPLENAIFDEDLDKVMELVEGEVDPCSNLPNEDFSYIHIAAMSGGVDILDYFYQKGYDLSVRSGRGITPLQFAAPVEYNEDIVPFYKEKGYDLNARDKFGRTALHASIDGKTLGMLKNLLENGANPYIPDNEGENAFDKARERNDEDIINLLEQFRDKYSLPPEDEWDVFEGVDSGEQESSSVAQEQVGESSYINEINHTGNKDSEAKVRQAVSAWADSIPHHGVRDMGNKINISSIYFRPTYLIGLHSVYDNRIVGSDAVPYTGQSFENQKYFKAADVNVWDFSLMQADGFKNKKDQFIVNGSHHVETCSRCSGHGKIQCPSCGGKGQETCSKCSGRGQTSCYSCAGSGSTRCSACGGTGASTRSVPYTEYHSDGSSTVHYRQVRESCNSCGGSGRKRCFSCGGTGKNTCSRCGGKGIIVCGRCHGSGSITCPTCRGHGQMLHYLTIEQTLHANPLKNCLLQYSVYERYPKFYVDPSSARGEIKLDETAVNLDSDILDTTHLSGIYKNMLNEAMSASFTQGHTKVVLQQCKVIMLDTFDIDYSFDGKDYHLLVWGYNGDYHVYAQVSPFSELRDNLLKKAEKRYKLRIWGKCFNLLEKADDLDVFDENERIYELKDLVEKKMFRQYRLGGLLGGLLSIGGIGWFSTFFFVKDWFLHPKIRELYSRMGSARTLHPYVVTGIFVLFVILAQNRVYKFLKEFYGNKIRHEWVRWIFPGLVSIIFSAIIWGGVFIVNATGLTLIPSKVLDVGIHVVQAIISFIKNAG